ncbi:MAG: helix-turn-helix domain-containing protein [Chloroflexi bacterium]|nr:helix-turn-helix domain-containing protein [Chloroflexota bacterium]
MLLYLYPGMVDDGEKGRSESSSDCPDPAKYTTAIAAYSMYDDVLHHHSDPEPDTLILEDRSLGAGFIQLPKLVLHARNLSRDAKLLFAILLSYAWQAARCFPGYRRLCEDMQASENMVRKYMRELEAVGLLSQKRRGLGKTNIYTLHDLRTAKLEVLEPQEATVLDPAKTAGKEESGKEERDYNLRNSKGKAGREEGRTRSPVALAA